MDSSVHAAYQEALQADNVWQASLVKAFGKRAGDVRYTELGRTHPDCVEAYKVFRAANDKWLNFVRLARQGITRGGVGTWQ